MARRDDYKGQEDRYDPDTRPERVNTQSSTGTRRAGAIIRLVEDKGFGFIREEQTGTEYFFHRSVCIGCELENLRAGDKVLFLPARGPKGMRAEQVSLVQTA